MAAVLCLLELFHQAKLSLGSKLGPKDQGERAEEAALRSLAQLDLGYIDLYLIHWPGTQNLPVSDQRNPGKERRAAVFNSYEIKSQRSCA